MAIPTIISSFQVQQPRGRAEEGAGPSRTSVRTAAARDSWKKWSPLDPQARWCLVPAPREDEGYSSEGVVEYLVQCGFPRREVELLELPHSIQVMQERLSFLNSVGLEREHILCYPQVLCCSVKRNMIPVVDYLENVGIPASDFPSFLRHFPMILTSSVAVDLKPVVDYLQGYGISPVNIPKVLLQYPDVLGFKLEGTMSTSVAYLVSIGVNPRRVGTMLTLFPQLLGMKVGNNIKKKVEYFSSLGFGEEELLRLLERHPYVLGYELEDTVRPGIACLVDAGVEQVEIPSMVARFPDIFGLDLSVVLEKKAAWLASECCMQPEWFAIALQKLPQVLVINEDKATQRIDFLKQAGFSDRDVGRMVSECPQILAMDLEAVVKPNFVFLEEGMERPRSELVEFPDFLTFSLDGRIKPRFARIEERGIRCSLGWFLACSDEKFERRLGLEYREAPDRDEEEEEDEDSGIREDEDSGNESSFYSSAEGV